ncbi:MAG: rhomboid family intramembrane serine protease [Acidobacteria bacterium]|nr:rhomboid family intramembrane serine protease [Acidobacteriota bacterium]
MLYDRQYYSKYSYSPPSGVKWLLISNIAVFVIYYLAAGTGLGKSFVLLALAPVMVLQYFAVWQLITYMFLHGSVDHILLNMLALWMFGMDLERDWGTRRFLKYYFLCGAGAGLCDVLLNAALGNWNTRTIGASGAVYGLLLAFGILYPNRLVLFMLFVPLRAKYLVMIYGGIAFLGAMKINTGVSHVAHLGGMIFGYAFLRMRFWRIDLGKVRREYEAFKLRRAKKRFQVYLRKHGSDRGPWVN